MAKDSVQDHKIDALSFRLSGRHHDAFFSHHKMLRPLEAHLSSLLPEHMHSLVLILQALSFYSN